MPCPDCNHTLAYHPGKERLFCPDCLSLPVADNDRVKQKASYIQDNYLNHPELLQILEEFGSVHVIASLLNEMNGGAHGMMTENRMPFKKFLYATPLLKNVYEGADAFEKYFDPNAINVQETVDERVDALLGADTILIPILNQIQEDFVVTIEQTPGIGDWLDFYGNHDFLHSEYWLCSERCMRATLAARTSIAEDFLQQQELFRSFDKPAKDDIETVRDYGDFWYGFIVSLGFAATLEDATKNALTTDFPDGVTIFDIEEFRNCIDQAIEQELTARAEQDHRPISLDEDDFDTCGEHVFGDDWDKVKDSILLTESNLDAHPLYFRIEGRQEMKLPNWRASRPVPVSFILYPDYYTILLERQIYPLLKNGDEPHSRDILADLTAKRGHEFERYVYEYLNEAADEAWFSCKTAKQNGNEVDVVFVHNGTVYFVEVKFVLPTLNMLSQRGIQDVNEKFDGLIFKEGSDDGGKPFPEKVGAWRSVDAGMNVLHTPSTDKDDREWITIPNEWRGLDYKMLVVSNFVPSYLEKQGVRFLTDLELYQWVENGDNVFYDVLC